MVKKGKLICIFLLFLVILLISAVPSRADKQRLCPDSSALENAQECVDYFGYGGGGYGYGWLQGGVEYEPTDPPLKFYNKHNLTFNCMGYPFNGNSARKGIEIIGSTNVTIINCSLSNFSEYYIYIESSKEITISKTNITMNGPYFWAYGIDFEGSEGITLDRDNIFTTPSQLAYGVQGVNTKFIKMNKVNISGNPESSSGIMFNNVNQGDVELTEVFACTRLLDPDYDYGISSTEPINPNNIVCDRVACDREVNVTTQSGSCCQYTCEQGFTREDQCGDLTPFWYTIQKQHSSCNYQTSVCVTNQGCPSNLFCKYCEKQGNNYFVKDISVENVGQGGGQSYGSGGGFFQKVWNFLTGGVIFRK
jgi:hypothetical protein